MSLFERFRGLIRAYRYVAILALAVALLALLGQAETQRSAAADENDPILAAFGDAACDPANPKLDLTGTGTSTTCRQADVAKLLLATSASAVAELGDMQYYCGSYEAIMGSYDKTFGPWKSVTYPTVGNHEYLTAPSATSPSTGCDSTNTGAAGYYKYFNGMNPDGTPVQSGRVGDVGRGFYSYDLGTWHIIVLNGNCSKAGSCSATSPQGKWLKADMAAHPAQCKVAYWHQPLFSQDTSGGKASPGMKVFWDQLQPIPGVTGASIVLNGHSHNYARYAPLNSDGTPNPNGIVEFIGGTGGSNTTSYDPAIQPAPVAASKSFGLLTLRLGADKSYDWKYTTTAGAVLDSGTAFGHC